MDNTGLIFSAGLLAGAMNSAAGGGSFVTLPALLWSGVPSVAANASSTVALFPGSLAGAIAYRDDYAGFHGVPVKAMLWASLAGGFAGALLLYTTPSTVFDKLIPWLLLLGTVAFALGPKAGLVLRRVIHIGPNSLLIGQALLGVYGGYFGGAVGIMMMAFWGLFGSTDIKAMNAAKTLLVGVTNSSAVLCFAVTGLVWWQETGTMLVGAMIGGYGGARLARRIRPHYLRAGTTIFNFTMTLYFFMRSHG